MKSTKRKLTMNKFIGSLIIVSVLAGCAAKDNYQGLEYAPNMYHSVPYEPLTQITDEKAGSWLDSRDDGVGEFYNSNPNNPNNLTMREPASNTVRFDEDYLPYRLPYDSLDYAGRVLKNPLDDADSVAVVAEGKVLYEQYCIHCHGKDGGGSQDPTAKVGEVYQGVVPYNVKRTDGYIFHVITHGRGRMYSHASQVSIEDRWKIAEYVQVLTDKNIQ